MNKLTRNPTKEKKLEKFDLLKQAYSAGQLAGKTEWAIAKEFGVTAPTVKKWLIKLRHPETVTIGGIKYEQDGIGVKRAKIYDVPDDWEWVSLSVPSDFKKDYDNLSDTAKAIAWKLLDAEIKLLDPSTFQAGRTALNNQLVKDRVNLKISPESSVIWKALATNRKNSRSAWAISQLKDFLSIVVQ